LTSNKFFDVEKVYDLLDRAKKGFIDLNDLVEFMASLHGGRGLLDEEISQSAELAFLRVDIDGDGKIGFRDWKSFLLGMKGSSVEESHKKNLHSSAQNVDSLSRPVSGVSQSQYTSNNYGSSEYELRRTSEYSRASNQQEIRETKRENQDLTFHTPSEAYQTRDARMNHRPTINHLSHIPSTQTQIIP
jgi:hypothetical protein